MPTQLTIQTRNSTYRVIVSDVVPGVITMERTSGASPRDVLCEGRVRTATNARFRLDQHGRTYLVSSLGITSDIRHASVREGNLIDFLEVDDLHTLELGRGPLVTP